MIIIRISAGGYELSLFLDSLPIDFLNYCSSIGEFASHRNLLRTFHSVDSIGLYLLCVFQAVFQAILSTTCAEASIISFM